MSHRRYSALSTVTFDDAVFRTDIAAASLRAAAKQPSGLTYAAAGVDIDAGNDLVRPPRGRRTCLCHGSTGHHMLARVSSLLLAQA